jgi:protease II
MVTLIKDLETGEFFSQIITETGDFIAFDKFNNFYFLRKNELGRTHAILKSSFSSQTP